MECKICGSNQADIIYEGQIRNGGLGQYTEQDISMYQCQCCKTIWHDEVIENIENYYVSQEYRKSLEGTSEEEEFYRLHDSENGDKFLYTGTSIFRNKIVADIGCGCGAFLDFVQGAARKVVAIEPSNTYRKVMDRKGYRTYAYAEDAKNDYFNKIDVITSFDVIEHVENPLAFVQDIYDLLNRGRAIIGTPTDAPIMRKLLGRIYEKKLLFSTQHLWIFTEQSLKLMAEKAGFKKIEIKYFQRYGIGNMLGWIKEKEARFDIKEEFLTDTLDAVWKNECSSYGMADYIVLYVYK